MDLSTPTVTSDGRGNIYFGCQWCGYVMTFRLETVASHVRVGDVDYHCPMCVAAFTLKRSLANPGVSVSFPLLMTVQTEPPLGTEEKPAPKKPPRKHPAPGVVVNEDAEL